MEKSKNIYSHYFYSTFARSPHQFNSTEKQNKQNMDWKTRSKTLIIWGWHDCGSRKLCGIYKKND